MNADLFLAILSMDSYNRGYGQGVTGLSNAVGTGIGNATISSDSVQKIGGVAQAAGFYAIAYDMTGVSGFSAGETVIAYRGSDGFLTGPEGSGGDVSAYRIALTGNNSAAQARLAITFYQAVADGLGSAGNLPYANITTTGHSLGGGLAGLVAGIYNRPGFFVDPMQFGTALNNAAAMLDPNNSEYDAAFYQFITNGNDQAWIQDRDEYFKDVAIPFGDISPQSNWLDFLRRNSQGISPTGATIRDIDFSQPAMLNWSTRDFRGHYTN